MGSYTDVTLGFAFRCRLPVERLLERYAAGRSACLHTMTSHPLDICVAQAHTLVTQALGNSGWSRCPIPATLLSPQAIPVCTPLLPSSRT